MSLLEKLFGSQSSSTLIESAFSDIENMLSHSKRMLEAALANLIDNEELTEDLDRLDDAVDRGEQMVRRAVLQHLTVDPKTDLVPSLILVSIVQDCERIGDFARGLGEITALAKSRREGEFRDRLQSCRQALLPLFEQTAAAFTGDELHKAQAVVEMTSEIKDSLTRTVEDVAASDLSADMAVVYSASARILARVAAHLSNVCSTVVQPYDRMRHGDEGA